jgi:hypothetical protein
LDEKFSTLNVDIVAYLCNIVSPVFGAEDSGMMVDSVFASLKNGFVYFQGSKYKTYFRDFVGSFDRIYQQNSFD